MFPLWDVRTILGIACLVLLPSVTAASADSASIESAITGWVLPAVLAFIMFTIGVDLEFADFVRVARHPTALAVGLLNQIILLPVTAYVIAIALALPPSLAVGIMILAACPGGPTSNLWTKIAGRRSALRQFHCGQQHSQHGHGPHHRQHRLPSIHGAGGRILGIWEVVVDDVADGHITCVGWHVDSVEGSSPG